MQVEKLRDFCQSCVIGSGRPLSLFARTRVQLLGYVSVSETWRRVTETASGGLTIGICPLAAAAAAATLRSLLAAEIANVSSSCYFGRRLAGYRWRYVLGQRLFGVEIRTQESG